MRNLDRRRFLARLGTGMTALSSGLITGCHDDPEGWHPSAVKPMEHLPADPVGEYPASRPNVILVRFGGGVRRRETIDYPEKTYCPFILHELGEKHGVVYENVEIASLPGIETDHGQGTLYLLTGEYRAFKDATGKIYGERFAAHYPTIPEYIRKRYRDVGEHQAIIINHENRLAEEFYTFSNHESFGISYRSSTLSLYGYKTYLLRQELANMELSDREKSLKEHQLQERISQDYRTKQHLNKWNPQVDAFWAAWRRYYGESGLVNPRGDRVLTTLALRALKQLRPRFLMINYQDPDYVHWGPAHFYTRALSIIDEGVREIYNTVQADDYYRDNTVFVIIPDCGRDNNRAAAVPYQHHFYSKSAHEIFAVVAGPKKFVPQSPCRIDRLQQQISIPATIGELMGYTARYADAESMFKFA